MVATANPLSTQAGLRMFAHGGNAVDAAVAAAAAVTVVEPYFSSVGGIGMAVLSLPDGSTRTLNFMGPSPRAAKLELFNVKTQDFGILAPMIPGNVAGWGRLLDEFGSLPLAQVLEPSIELAERGAPVTVFDNVRTAQALDRLTWPDAARTFLQDGQPYRPGEVLRQPGLATTLRTIASEGWMSFYRGGLARTIAGYFAEHGGLITEADLQAFSESLVWETPVVARYRGFEIRTTPPPTSAVQVLQTLRILEAFDLGDEDPLGPDALATIAEAIRLARMDCHEHVADPRFVDVPLDWMISDERIDELRAETAKRLKAGRRRASRNGADGRRPGARVRRATRAPERSTTHLGAADASGLAVNITQTIGSSFGSGVVVGDTGITMNNGHHWCTLIPGDPRVLAPDKKRESPTSPVHGFALHDPPVAPTHSFSIDRRAPAIGTRAARLAFVVGTPGSYGIPQTTAQVILGLVEWDRNIQDAIAAPRFRWKDDVGDPLPPDTLLMEGRFVPPTRRALAARGYKIEMLEEWSMRVGGAQGIVFREDGWLQGGADPRRNGYAMGW